MIPNIEKRKEDITRRICHLWGDTTEQQIKLITDHLIIEKFRKGDIIYKEFERPKYMMCLIDGKVKVHKDGINKRNQIVRVIKPTDFFGLRAYFANEDYRTTAEAFEKSTVAFIPFNVLVQLITENYHISLYLISQLSIKLGDADQRTINLTQKHIRGRLAEALLFLKDSYGLEEDGYTLSIYLSREEMANLSNMTTNNAIRTLSAFADEKIIAIDGRKVKILNEKELQNISQRG